MKRVLVATLLVAFAVLGVIGCQAAQAQTPTPPSPTLDVAIQVTVKGGDLPMIIGTTNLPEGFLALAALRKDGKILARDHIEVHSGKFTAGPFSAGGAAYPRGTYGLSIDSPFTDLQPKPVQGAIGQDGMFLRGPLVTRDFLGNGRVVHFQTQFEIR
jgi:hypothetical protein